jgi:hypothetical protein
LTGGASGETVIRIDRWPAARAGEAPDERLGHAAKKRVSEPTPKLNNDFGVFSCRNIPMNFWFDVSMGVGLSPRRMPPLYRQGREKGAACSRKEAAPRFNLPACCPR